jgi:nitrite reductase/ring-hydroxylating ferredoxin subunit
MNQSHSAGEPTPDASATGTNRSEVDRRSFVSKLTASAMISGLAASYGTFAAMAGRYLYPARPAERRWMFVAELSSVGVGGAIPYSAPDGRQVSITRLSEKGTADDFVALSGICPHLGCQVHWETQNQRFFCPCHNGAFDSQGVATEGPPFDARQSLARFPLMVENGLLYIEVSMEA